MESIVLKVKGMSCDQCAKKVRRAVNVFEGYESAKVDVEKGEVTIEFEPPATVNGFIAAIEGAGFTVEK